MRAMRIVIVGSGVIALLTAVTCVSDGHEVVLIEQGDIPFPGAASFDRHRNLRALHLGDPAATAAVVRAHYRWIDLQRQLSARFYEQVGALTVLPPQDLPVACAMLTEAGSSPLVLCPEELAARHGHLRFPAGASAVLESHAGVLLADRILVSCAEWLGRHPRAELRPHLRAVRVQDGAAIRLADGEVVQGDAALLATGPWSRALLSPDLAGELVLHRQSMIYCDVPAADAAAWLATPAIASLGTEGGAWLVPPVAGTPLKLSAASACRVVADKGDNSTPSFWRDHLVDAFTAVIPGFSAGWLVGARDCYYLTRGASPDPMLAVLDDGVMSFAACGGSAFKFAPLIAQTLAGRLTGGDPVPTGLRSIDDEVMPVSSGTLTRRRPTDP
jgi:glycine/D-amino acid oxidase-like deaminating enzyme